MSKIRTTFRQSDITRALKAGLAAGVDIVRVEITPDGKISMIVKRPNGTTVEESRGDEWGNI